ncbi:MAG: tetratricopeptide repeat protein [Planctomycetaceae bacterium]|nr:MAG: tetratricopeptide repeat protein [Planctomycetaceae bacterium]
MSGKSEDSNPDATRDHDREVTTADLFDPVMMLQVQSVYGGHVSADASAAHQRATELLSSGKFDDAILALAQIQEMEPEWPRPAYDTAFAHLLNGEYAQAAEFYKQTLDILPTGFLDTITAIDTLEREARGEFPRGTYRGYAGYLSMSALTNSSFNQFVLLQMIERCPVYAPPYLHSASLTTDPQERLKLIEQGLACNPDRETKSRLLICKALVHHESGDNESTRKLLESVAAGESTFITQRIAKRLLSAFDESEGKQEPH